MNDREARYAGHPAYCTCVECTNSKLGRPGRKERFDPRFFSSGKVDKGFVSTKRVAPTHSNRRPGSRFSISKLFLLLLAITCIVAIVCTTGLLYTGKTSPTISIAIFVVAVVVLIWNISALRSYRVNFGNALAIFLATALLVSTVCAFAGIGPFARCKDTIVSKIGALVEKEDETDRERVKEDSGPQGTYSCTKLGIENTLTISRDRLVLYNPLDGKSVYNYEFVVGNWYDASKDIRTGTIELTILTSRGWKLSKGRFIYQTDIEALTIEGVTFYK